MNSASVASCYLKRVRYHVVSIRFCVVYTARIHFRRALHFFSKRSYVMQPGAGTYNWIFKLRPARHGLEQYEIATSAYLADQWRVLIYSEKSFIDNCYVSCGNFNSLSEFHQRKSKCFLSNIPLGTSSKSVPKSVSLWMTKPSPRRICLVWLLSALRFRLYPRVPHFHLPRPARPANKMKRLSG